MKKLSVIIIGLIILSVSALASLEEKMEEMNRISDYVKALDSRIEAARKARKINQVAQLKELKREQLERARTLKVEIDGEKPVPAAPAKPTPVVSPAAPAKPLVLTPAKDSLFGEKWYGTFGYLGGGANVDIARDVTLNKFTFQVDGGLAIGGLLSSNAYTILTIGAAKLFPVGQNVAGVKLVAHVLSANITDVVGITGVIDQGTKYGLAAFARTQVKEMQVEIGFDSALGLTLGVIKEF